MQRLLKSGALVCHLASVLLLGLLAILVALTGLSIVGAEFGVLGCLIALLLLPSLAITPIYMGIVVGDWTFFGATAGLLAASAITGAIGAIFASASKDAIPA